MKQLTLIPIGGLANRFYAITSAIAFCKDYNIKLRVIWFKDKGMGADFHSLFELSEDVDKSNVEIIDAKWYHYIYDRPRKRNLWLPWLWQYFVFDVKFYEKDISAFDIDFLTKSIDKYIYIVYCSPFYVHDVKNKLFPQKVIIEEVKKIINRFASPHNFIGIHIRRADNLISIKKSPLELFIKAIDTELYKDPSVHFYIASDSVEEKLKLKQIYGDRVYISLEVVERNRQDGIKNAMIDLYILSYAKKIYGSAYSSFSTLAAEISGKQLRVLSV